MIIVIMIIIIQKQTSLKTSGTKKITKSHQRKANKNFMSEKEQEGSVNLSSPTPFLYLYFVFTL